MTTELLVRRSSRWLRPKYVLFAAVFLMMAYVLQHNERFLVDSEHPVWAHYQPFKWWLLPHGVAGACALLLGPLQFSDRLRQRYTKLHRVVGRIYVGGVLVAAPVGVYIHVSGVFGLDDAGPAVAETIVWVCLTSSLLVADVVLQLQESWRRRPAHRSAALPLPSTG